jgi:hypothetical protein
MATTQIPTAGYGIHIADLPLCPSPPTAVLLAIPRPICRSGQWNPETIARRHSAFPNRH